MEELTPRVIVIPAKPEYQKGSTHTRQLRAAAYCRVSTDEEDQLNSFNAQKEYYTDLIMKNPEWSMAGIFADEGITGTSVKKREDFKRMLKQCRQHKIDIILTKSVSRFARNTVDCLKYVRALKELGVAVIFEKEKINTMEMDNEILLTMLGAFSQGESESISSNVRWGKRQAMREGKASIQYKRLYAFEKGENGKPQPLQRQGQVVETLCKKLLAGASLRMLQTWLIENEIPNKAGTLNWTTTAILSILTDEKNCGDVLMQKTFTDDCINRKVIKNTGQLPMYLIQNHHEGVISRELFNAVQAELARRRAARSPSKKAPTGLSKFTSRYALSDRMVCGECGTLYRRCTWKKNGKTRVVWRCVSRLDYGTKYCHNSPSIDEFMLHTAILDAINRSMTDKKLMTQHLYRSIEYELRPYNGMSKAQVQEELDRLQTKFDTLLIKASDESIEVYASDFDRILEEQTKLKILLNDMDLSANGCDTDFRVEAAIGILENSTNSITEWDESLARQLVDTVTVLSSDRVLVKLCSGVEIEEKLYS